MWKVNHIKFVRDADIYRFFHNKYDSTNIRDKRWQQFDSDLKEVIFFCMLDLGLNQGIDILVSPQSLCILSDESWLVSKLYGI